MFDTLVFPEPIACVQCGTPVPSADPFARTTRNTMGFAEARCPYIAGWEVWHDGHV